MLLVVSVNPRTQDVIINEGDWTYDQKVITPEIFHKAIASAGTVWKKLHPEEKVLFLGLMSESKLTKLFQLTFCTVFLII